MTSSEQASWETNTYVVTTTRIFVVLGLTYLIKISYQVYRRLRTSNGSTVIHDRMIKAAEETNNRFELALNDGDADPFGLETIISVEEEMVEVRRPVPVYYPDGPVDRMN